jgi:hypothetical protein
LWKIWIILKKLVILVKLNNFNEILQFLQYVAIFIKYDNFDKIWQFWQNLIILTIFDQFGTTPIYYNHKKVLLLEMHIVWQCVFGYKITHCLIWELMLLINWFWKNYTMFLILKNIIYTINFNFLQNFISLRKFKNLTF